MRVIIEPENVTERDCTRKAALQCWGGPDWAQVITALHDATVLKRLNARSAWPDVIITSFRSLEQHPQLTRAVKRHPRRRYFCRRVFAARTGRRFAPRGDMGPWRMQTRPRSSPVCWCHQLLILQ